MSLCPPGDIDHGGGSANCAPLFPAHTIMPISMICKISADGIIVPIMLRSMQGER
jgi:hypothetical protein